MRPIDADDLMNCVNRKHSEVGKSRYTEGFNDAVLRVRSMIHSAKTIDAVEVVRCKDCKWWETYKGKPEQSEYNCYKLEVFTNGEFYCADGRSRK